MLFPLPSHHAHHCRLNIHRHRVHLFGGEKEQNKSISTAFFKSKSQQQHSGRAAKLTVYSGWINYCELWGNTKRSLSWVFFSYVATATTAVNLQCLTATVIKSLDAWKLQMDTRDCDSLGTTEGIKRSASLLNLKTYSMFY